MKKTAPKKTIAKKTTPKKTAPKKASRAAQSSAPIEITFRRIILISGLVLLLGALFLIPNKQAIQQDVAGLSIARPLYNQATVELPKIENAASYTIYYKATTESEFENSVSKIPTNVERYTISYLTKSTEYEYKIAVADGSGAEFYWTEVKRLENVEGM